MVCEKKGQNDVFRSNVNMDAPIGCFSVRYSLVRVQN